MKPGSVVVDMAAAQGGNVEGTVAGEVVVTDNGVTHHRLHRPGRAAAGPGLAALRHEPGQPDQAADPGQGRAARRSTSTTSCSAAITVVRDGEVTVAAAAGAGLRRARAADRRARRAAPVPPATEGLAAAGATRRSGVGAARAVPRRRVRPGRARRALHRVGARGRDRLLRHRQGAPRPAHAADVGDQRDLRDHRGRRAAADRAHETGDPDARVHRDPARVASTSSAASPSPAGCSRMFSKGSRRSERRGRPIRPRPPTSSRRCCSSCRWPGCRGTRPPGRRRLRHRRHGDRAGRDGRARGRIASTAGAARCWSRRCRHRRRRSGCGAPGVVEMTGMPELIALLHSFVGLAAVLVGWNGYLEVEADAGPDDSRRTLLDIHQRRGRASACSSARSPSPARSSRT